MADFNSQCYMSTSDIHLLEKTSKEIVYSYQMFNCGKQANHFVVGRIMLARHSISGIAYLLGQYRNLFYFADHFSIFDLLILFPYWIGFIIILETFPYILASDLILLISRWFSASFKANLTNWIAFIKIALLTFFVFFVR